MSAAGSPKVLERRIVIGLAAGAVALVVVIAATVLLRPPGVAPAELIVSVTSGAGNWTLAVLASAPLLRTDQVFFLTRTPAGEPFSPLLPLTELEDLSRFQDTDPIGILDSGDAVVLPRAEYPAGLTYWFLESDRLLAVGTLA